MSSKVYFRKGCIAFATDGEECLSKGFKIVPCLGL